MARTKQSPVLIDTNLLVLLIVGTVSRNLIERHKKTRTFTVGDYDLLLRHLGNRPILLLPNVVTETSNLLAFHPGSERMRLLIALQTTAGVYEEQYVASKLATRHRDFNYLGVTDAAILSTAGKAEVLTTDALLYAAALRHGHATVNFNHLRDGLTV